MLKFFLIGSILLLTVGCLTVQEVQQTGTPHLTIIKDVAYSLVIEELEGIIESIKNNFIWTGAADPVILNVSNAFIARNKADERKQELIDTDKQRVQVVMNTLSEIYQKMVREANLNQLIIRLK